ncbi:MAG: hypothetical protein AB7E60_13930, partial [Sphingobium sp.]
MSGSIGFSRSAARKWAASQGVLLMGGGEGGARLAPLWGTMERVAALGDFPVEAVPVAVPSGKRLASPRHAARLKASAACTLTRLVDITGDGGVVSGVTIDASLAAREAAGFASYTHGGSSLNRNDVLWEDVTVTDYGETAAQAALLNTCAIVIDSDASASAVTSGGVIRGCRAIDRTLKAPYGFRLRSQFIGYQRGEIPGLSKCVIEDSEIIGTTKNAVELAGPNVFDCVVRRVRVRNMIGQGGIETDYGAHGILFEECDVGHFGADGVITRSTAAFSWRSSDQGDSKTKEGSGNRAVDCRVHHFTSAGAYTFKAFHLISVRDSVIERLRVHDIRRGADAAISANVGIYIETNHGEVHNIAILDPDIRDVDIPVQISGSNACSDIFVRGGRWKGSIAVMPSRPRRRWPMSASAGA